MATKKKISPAKQEANAAKLEASRFRRDASTASSIYDRLGLNAPLSRMDATVPTDMQNNLTQVGAQLDPNGAAYVGARSQQMKDILSRMEGGLSGLTGPEMQGMREQAMGEVMRQRATATNNMAAAAARSGIRGAAATAGQRDLNRDTQRSQQQFENKLLTDNIGIQDSRQNAYLGAVSGAENSEYGKVADKQKMYSDLINQRNNYTTGANQFNAAQEGTERAARSAGLFGLMQYGQAGRLGNKQIEVARGANRASGGGGGNNQAMIDAYSKIFKDRYGEEVSV